MPSTRRYRKHTVQKGSVMKRALILYWHGLGDVIMLTPHLRHLHKRGYKIDLMCRVAVRDSKLLETCSYINRLIIVENPWRSKLGFARQAKLNIELFNRMKDGYDWAGASPHNTKHVKRHKIDMTSAELGLDIKDKKLEVFIPESAEEEALRHKNGKYIFVQTILEFHAYHNWDASEWIKAHLPPLRIMDLGYKRQYHMAFDDINTAFVLAREATHRILSSGVFVHACEAMGCTIDVINYGRADHKVWPLNQPKVLRIREAEEWIR